MVINIVKEPLDMKSCKTVYDELMLVWNEIIMYLDESEVYNRQPFFEYVLENQEDEHVKKYCIKIINLYKKYLSILVKSKDDITREDMLWLLNYYYNGHIVRPYIIVRYFEVITNSYIKRRNKSIEELYIDFLQRHWNLICENYDYREKIEKALIKINHYVEKDLRKEKEKDFSRELVKRIKKLQIFKSKVEALIKLV